MPSQNNGFLKSVGIQVGDNHILKAVSHIDSVVGECHRGKTKTLFKRLECVGVSWLGRSAPRIELCRNLDSTSGNRCQRSLLGSSRIATGKVNRFARRLFLASSDSRWLACRKPGSSASFQRWQPLSEVHSPKEFGQKAFGQDTDRSSADKNSVKTQTVLQPTTYPSDAVRLAVSAEAAEHGQDKSRKAGKSW